MAIQDKLDIEVCFNLNNATPRIEVTDNTDYPSEGILLADVVGILTILDPTSGVIYQNIDFGTPDIDLDVSTLFADDAAAIPLDADNNPVKGTYSVGYTIRVVGATQPGDYAITEAPEFCHQLPDPCIEIEVDCSTSSLTSDDQTNYNQYATATSIVRTHTHHPPQTSPVTPDTVGATKELTTSPILTKNWEVSISTVLTLEYPDGHTVLDTLFATANQDVICDTNLCDIYCCVDSAYRLYRDTLAVNPIAAREREATWQLILSNVVLFEQARVCGDKARADELYNEILKLGNCKPGCSCDATEPIPVVPITIIQGPAGPAGPAGPSGLVYEHSEEKDVNPAQGLTAVEAVVDTMSRIITGGDGNYLVYASVNIEMLNASTGSLRLYVNGVQEVGGAIGADGVTNITTFENFTWFGPVLNGQTIEVRGISPSANINVEAFTWVILKVS